MDGIEYEDWDRLVKDEYAEYCDLKREEQYDRDHGIGSVVCHIADISETDMW